MKLYHLVAYLIAVLAVFEIVCLDIEAELKATESLRTRMVGAQVPVLVDLKKGE